MKKSVTLALLLALGMGPALLPAHAEDGLGIKANIKANVSVNEDRRDGTTTGTSTQDNGRDEDNGGNRGVLGQIRAEVKTNMGFRAELVRANLKVAVEVYDATINRMNRIIARIESRLAKIQAAGGSTVEATADVNAAKANIADAQAQITAMGSLDFSSTTASSTLVSNYQTARTDAKKAREDLTDAKKNLMKAVQAMVKVEVGLHVNASSTASTTKGEND